MYRRGPFHAKIEEDRKADECTKRGNHKAAYLAEPSGCLRAESEQDRKRDRRRQNDSQQRGGDRAGLANDNTGRDRREREEGNGYQRRAIHLQERLPANCSRNRIFVHPLLPSWLPRLDITGELPADGPASSEPGRSLAHIGVIAERQTAAAYTQVKHSERADKISRVTAGRFGGALGELCEHEHAGNRKEDRKAASEPPVGKAMEDQQPKPRPDQCSGYKSERVTGENRHIGDRAPGMLLH